MIAKQVLSFDSQQCEVFKWLENDCLTASSDALCDMFPVKLKDQMTALTKLKNAENVAQIARQWEVLKWIVNDCRLYDCL